MDPSRVAIVGAPQDAPSVELTPLVLRFREMLAGIVIAASRRKRIPHLGVVVRRTDVRRHRYLARHRLPYSATVASVMLPEDRVTH